MAIYTSNNGLQSTVTILQNSNGLPINPTTLVSKVLDPSGTITDVSGTIENIATGSYTATYLPTIQGQYKWEWIGTGNVEVAIIDTFFVSPMTF